MKILFELLIVAFLIYVCEGSSLRVRPLRRNPRIRTSSWSCPIPKLQNGTFRLQRAGRMGYFYCAQGFEIHGPMSILCTSGRWKQDIPICIKAGCPNPPKRSNGMVMLDEKKQISMLFCHDEYVVSGGSTAYCNGKTWDRELGECQLDPGHSKMCDFETISLCGWTQDEENDFHWVRKSGWTSFEKLEYGPKHDHTKGIPLEGHYMIAEATNSRTSQRSRILSPIYNQTDSENACFRFFYHMYGQNVGRLRVIVKPIDDAMDEVVDNPQNILFENDNSQGNQWNEAVFEIEQTKTEFQIVVEATGSRGLISDIAIDDVALMKDGDCMKYLNTLKPETAEADGIFNTQSCANRCLETESVRGNKSNETFYKDGHLIERCDCHQECADTLTCCLDYVTTCIESTGQPTDSDVAINTFDESSTEITIAEVDEVTTSVRTTVKTTIATTTSTTTQKPIIVTTITSSTTSTTPRITSIVSTTSTPLKTITNNITKSTVTRASKVTNTTLSMIPAWKKPFMTEISPTEKVNLTQLNITTNTPSKTTEIITKPIKSTKMSTTLMTTSPKKFFSSIQLTKITSPTLKPVLKITSTSKITQKIRQFVTQKEDRNAAWETSTHSRFVSITSTDATLNAMLMNSNNVDKQISRGHFAWISTIVLICVISMLMLTGWKYFSAQKWNKFNSHQIEYKSNYHSDDHEESLVRSDSFIIDDSFNETLIDKSIDEDAHHIENKNNSKSKKSANDMIKTNATVPNITKKVSDRLSKKCDQYSEKRCLTIDDEQFDFSLQMHE